MCTTVWTTSSTTERGSLWKSLCRREVCEESKEESLKRCQKKAEVIGKTGEKAPLLPARIRPTKPWTWAIGLTWTATWMRNLNRETHPSFQANGTRPNSFMNYEAAVFPVSYDTFYTSQCMVSMVSTCRKMVSTCSCGRGVGQGGGGVRSVQASVGEKQDFAPQWVVVYTLLNNVEVCLIDESLYVQWGQRLSRNEKSRGRYVNSKCGEPAVPLPPSVSPRETAPRRSRSRRDSRHSTIWRTVMQCAHCAICTEELSCATVDFSE